jgi:hypothetical protein
MPRMNQFDPMRFRLWRPAWWQLALLGALAIAIVLAIAVVATSLILIIAPIALVAVLAHRFLGRRATPRGDVRPDARYQVIDAEYEIVSTQPGTERPPPGSGGDRPRPE